jgi:hypothetical protein
MNRKDLANEIRAAGFALRYADGPVTRFSFRDGEVKGANQSLRKLRASDTKIVSMAATCSQCDAAAHEYDVKFAEEAADCYQSFARLIWPCIDHAPGCRATPYLPVSEKAAKSFAKIKAKFDAMQQRHLKELEARVLELQSKEPRSETEKPKKKAAKKATEKKKAVKKKAAKKSGRKKSS